MDSPGNYAMHAYIAVENIISNFKSSNFFIEKNNNNNNDKETSLHV